MTQRPVLVPERPVLVAEDLLSVVLRTVRFTRALYYTVDAPSLWPAIRVPKGASLSSGMGSSTQIVLSYHVLVAGTCWTGLEDGSAVRLEAGDVVVYPRGDAYFLAPDLRPRLGSADATQMVDFLASLLSGAVPPNSGLAPNGLEQTRFVCGFLGCDVPPFDPMLRALPPMLVIRAASGRLRDLVDLALAEVNGAGGASVRERLSESIFIETLRLHLASPAPDRLPTDADWMGGLRDPVVGRALALLHERLAEPWTLAALAREAGASRTTLAERFTRLVGEPPMRYLAGRRMQLAARRLSEGDVTVAEVAAHVGYESEAAFSRAFKRSTAAAPATWRDQRRQSGP